MLSKLRGAFENQGTLATPVGEAPVGLERINHYKVWVWTCSGDSEGWDQEDVYAASPEAAWRKAQRNWRRNNEWEPEQVELVKINV